MEGIQFFLLVAQIVIAILMIILVLAQKSDGDSLSGISPNATNLNSVISGKASTSLISKITMVLIGLFMINSLALASITKNKSNKISQELEQAIQEHNSKSSPNKSQPDAIQASPSASPSNETNSTKPSVPEVQ